MQHLRVESEDRALHKSGQQLHSQRMEPYQASYLTTVGEKDWLCTELEEREKSSAKNSFEKSSGNRRIESFTVQKVKELNK